MIYFTSDTHFSHAAIIKHCNRSFKDVYEHDAALIVNWNAVVGPGDTVYHLGDFGLSNSKYAISAILKQLNGQKFLITGNHDWDPVKKATGWVKVTPYHELTVQHPVTNAKQKIALFHYRMVVWRVSHYGSWALHGHSHGTLPVSPYRTFDVGTDCWNYRPISLVEVAQEMETHLRAHTDVDEHANKGEGGFTSEGHDE